MRKAQRKLERSITLKKANTKISRMFPDVSQTKTENTESKRSVYCTGVYQVYMHIIFVSVILL